ncbi:putative serine/threonine-protein kinase MPS1 like protein, partial [Nosema granulosis]
KNYEEKKIEKNYEEKKIEKNYEIKIEEKNEISHCTISEKQYRKCGIIGKGGNSKVYLVENNNKFYALKVVNIEMDQKLRKSTLKEIDILQNLKGSYGIIDLIDTRIDTENIYILLEYGSIDLAKYIRRNHLSLNAIRFFWEQMLRILQVVHSNRIIHADIKPANFVIVDGNLKLIDFNISSKIKADTTRLDLESACGTLNYVAPEILDSTLKQRRRGSDVWSLGIILYEMLYKRVPVDYTTNSADWLEKIQNMDDFVKDDGGEYSEIIKIIRACLRKNPKDRPTVEELLENF